MTAFGWIYPPGVRESDPRAPWNAPDLLAECEQCGKRLLSDADGERLVNVWGEELVNNGELREGDKLCEECAEECVRDQEVEVRWRATSIWWPA